MLLQGPPLQQLIHQHTLRRAAPQQQHDVGVVQAAEDLDLGVKLCLALHGPRGAVQGLDSDRDPVQNAAVYGAKPAGADAVGGAEVLCVCVGGVGRGGEEGDGKK
jgi:hypothetical protein